MRALKQSVQGGRKARCKCLTPTSLKPRATIVCSTISSPLIHGYKAYAKGKNCYSLYDGNLAVMSMHILLDGALKCVRKTYISENVTLERDNYVIAMHIYSKRVLMSLAIKLRPYGICIESFMGCVLWQVISCHLFALLVAL